MKTKTLVNEYPIIFSTPMVRAILDGRKTQTRRILKGAGIQWINDGFTNEFIVHPENDLCPYGKIGNIIWVRESFMPRNNGKAFLYKANYSSIDAAGLSGMYGGWKPSIHMPRTACRLFLEIVNIKVERVQEISWEDAEKEGCYGYRPNQYEPTHEFKHLWDEINGKRASWESNPYVWCISFKPTAPSSSS